MEVVFSVLGSFGGIRVTKFGRMGFSAERAELRLIKCVFESRRQSLPSVASESAEGRILRGHLQWCVKS